MRSYTRRSFWDERWNSHTAKDSITIEHWTFKCLFQLSPIDADLNKIVSEKVICHEMVCN